MTGGGMRRVAEVGVTGCEVEEGPGAGRAGCPPAAAPADCGPPAAREV
jgi:hypothetical protein